MTACMRLVALALATTLLFAACGSDEESADVDPYGDWLLERIDVSGVDPTPVAASTLNIDEVSVAGDSGCNTFGDAFTFDDDGTVTFEGEGDMISTAQGCDEALGDQEVAIFQTLLDATTWDIEERTLVISAGDDSLTYVAIAP